MLNILFGFQIEVPLVRKLMKYMFQKVETFTDVTGLSSSKLCRHFLGIFPKKVPFFLFLLSNRRILIFLDPQIKNDTPLHALKFRSYSLQFIFL